MKTTELIQKLKNIRVNKYDKEVYTKLEKAYNLIPRNCSTCGHSKLNGAYELEKCDECDFYTHSNWDWTEDYKK